MKQKLNKYIKLIIKLLITAIIIIIIIRKVDFSQVTQILRKAQWGYLLLAALFFMFSKMVAAFRLNYFFRSIGIHLSNSFNLKLYLLGMYYNLFLPGGIGGDGYKIYLLNKYFSVGGKRIFWAIFTDRLSGLLALFCLAALCAIFRPFATLITYLAGLAIPVSLLAFYGYIRLLFGHFSGIVARTTGLSFIVQTAQIISVFFILLAVSEQAFQQPGWYIFIFLISSIVAAIPVTIGGFGAREITFVLAAEQLQIEKTISITLSLLFYLITAIVSFSGIYFSINEKSMRSRFSHSPTDKT